MVNVVRRSNLLRPLIDGGPSLAASLKTTQLRMARETKLNITFAYHAQVQTLIYYTRCSLWSHDSDPRRSELWFWRSSNAMLFRVRKYRQNAGRLY